MTMFKKASSLIASTILISTTALTPALVPSAAHAAGHGHRFVDAGIRNPQEFRAKFLAALQKDPTGNAKVEGGWASPVQILEAFQATDPGAGLTSLNDIPAYLDSLEETTPEKGADYQSSYIEADGVTVNVDGEVRPFDPGEKAWMNPKTKKIVLAGRCANPVAGIVRPISVAAPPCAFIHAGTHPGDTLAVAILPDGDWADGRHCLAIKLPGQKNFAELVDNCDAHTCFKQVEEQVGLRSKFVASYKVMNGGVVDIRVPSWMASAQTKSATSLCDTQSNGIKSCGKLVVGTTYRKLNAYVTYKGEEKPDQPGVNWHWSNEIQCPEGKITW